MRHSWGPATALRWRSKSDWQMFDLTREVYETTELTLTMALSGLGDVRFDDLEIIPLDVDSSLGKAVAPCLSPVGTAEVPCPAVPTGLRRRVPPDPPAMNRWAILACPYGTTPQRG